MKKKFPGEIVFIVGITAVIVIAMLVAGWVLSPWKAGSGTGFTVRVSVGKDSGPPIKGASVSYKRLIASVSSQQAWEQVVTTATTDARGYATLAVNLDEVTTATTAGFEVVEEIEVEHSDYFGVLLTMSHEDLVQKVSRRRIIKIALEER